MAEEYKWDMSIKEIWEKAAKNPPEVPHYQKLVTLAQLKTADRLASYTKWLMGLTFVLTVCTLVQMALVLAGMKAR